MPPQAHPDNIPHYATRTRSHTFLITLTILLILSGIFGVWYFSQPAPDLESEFSSLQKSDNSDWKTYRNEEYGFEFRYPKEYEVTLTSTKVLEISESRYGDTEHPGIWIYTYQNNNLQPLDWWKKSKSYQAQDQISSIKNIFGIEGIKINSSEGLQEQHLVFGYKDRIIDVLNIGINEYLINQILSTFKFTK